MLITEYYPQFFTATILEWKHLLNENKYKDIIVESLRFLVKEKRVVVYSFVIMPNHIHIIWHIQGGYRRENVQRDFLKFTSQKIKYDLKNDNNDLLKEFEVNAKDRQYQLWERNPLSIDIYNRKVFMEKLNYIHRNPVHEKWSLCKYPEDYKYSTAQFYQTGKDNWGFLTHIAD
jgi:REP element-mobilizing transposase RayT